MNILICGECGKQSSKLFPHQDVEVCFHCYNLLVIGKKKLITKSFYCDKCGVKLLSGRYSRHSGSYYVIHHLCSGWAWEIQPKPVEEVSNGR